MVLTAENGNIREVERLLGLSPGYLGDNPYIVEIVNYAGLRIPSGREPGADAAGVRLEECGKQLWIWRQKEQYI